MKSHQSLLLCSGLRLSAHHRNPIQNRRPLNPDRRPQLACLRPPGSWWAFFKSWVTFNSIFFVFRPVSKQMINPWGVSDLICWKCNLVCKIDIGSFWGGLSCLALDRRTPECLLYTRRSLWSRSFSGARIKRLGDAAFCRQKAAGWWYCLSL